MSSGIAKMKVSTLFVTIRITWVLVEFITSRQLVHRE